MEGVSRGEYYRMITGPFGHGSFVHFWLNLCILHFISTRFESEPPLLKFCFYLVFFLSLLGGSISYAIFGGEKMSVGISGGLCGLMGYCLVVFSGDFRKSLKNCLIFTLVLGVFFPDYIDNITHLTGLFVGYLCGKLFIKNKPFNAGLST